ncbi:MAG: hypothetical protein KOO62_04210 [candidate division Zixibacteria bacterium]|nr:hypothetical protein [candidate division Zixibacteria bacterium]
MHNILKTVAVLAALALAISMACSDRGANQAPDIVDLPVAPARFDHSFSNEFFLQIANTGEMALVDAYIPNRVFQQDQLPVVVLLPPQDGSEDYYYRHGLSKIADELIANGEIVPMAIVTINNHETFGGFFWAGNGGASGDYDALFGRPLLDWLSSHSGDLFKDDGRYRGIGGIGQGAYGAFRAAMLHRNEYSSIAVADGPLDFDGADGVSGFEDLFADVLSEQGLLDYVQVGDTSWTDKFDSSASAYPLGRMFIGGALAFSPNDTLVFPYGERGYMLIPIPVIDTFYDTTFIIGYPNVIDTLYDTLRYQIDDEATLCTEIINIAENDFEFHLPFDVHGEPYDLIWDLWLKNNLETILSDSGDGCLADVDIWIGTTEDPSEQDMTFGYQTHSWINTLQSHGLLDATNVYEYSGYSTNPATKDQYVYDLLREMLIFHSRNFEAAQAAE